MTPPQPTEIAELGLIALRPMVQVVTDIGGPAIVDHTLALFAEAGQLVERLTRAELFSLQLERGCEVGLVVFPVDSGTQTSLAAEVDALKASGAEFASAAFIDVWPPNVSYPFVDQVDNVIVTHCGSSIHRVRSLMRQVEASIRTRALQGFVEASMDGYWIWDPRNNGIYWSDRMRELARLTPDEVPKGMDEFFSILHPDDQGPISQEIRAHLENNEPMAQVRMRVGRPDRGYADLDAGGVTVRGLDGQPIFMVGAVKDMSVQRRIEQRLAESEERYSILFHYMNDAAILADPETGIIEEANEPAVRLWKRPLDDLIGSHQSGLHPADLDQEAREAFALHVEALRRDNRASIQMPILRSNGTTVPVEISSSLIEIGGRTMVLGLFRDITERVQSEQAIRERDAQLQLASRLAAMGTLAAGVGHEINNPLSYVLGNLQFVASELDKTAVDPEIGEALSEAIEGAERVGTIVRDLRSISRHDHIDDDCDPGEVVRIATRIAMSDIRHRTELITDLQPTHKVAMSGSRLTQVLINLLTNAAHSFGDGGRVENRITVTVSALGNGARLTVQDNGAGIPEDVLDHIFEPFFTTKSASSGTGLGLAICRRLLSEVGATLEISSVVGEGTVAVVDVPYADDVQHQVVAAPEPPAGQPTVLVIDDDPFAGRAVQRLLRNTFEVTLVRDPDEALRSFADGTTFDAILCDLMMPTMTGEQLYMRAIEKRPELENRFIFITGGAVTPGAARFENDMATEDRVVHKPASAADLTAAIERVLD